VSESDQVKALQQAILQRAQTLSDEHIEQGKLTRGRIIQDAREKIKLMEQKELLAARLQSEREYQRQVQASELRIQAELDRNRWGLVQSVLDKVKRQLAALPGDDLDYQALFENLLRQGVAKIGLPRLIASINSEDMSRFADNWETLVKNCCGDDVKIKLSSEASRCSGGVKLVSEAGDVMIDNTFEGIMARRDEALQRLIFERLFSTVTDRGVAFDG
jgi:vacuolar-type H+-ATPase subunit E/Vma4